MPRFNFDRAVSAYLDAAVFSTTADTLSLKQAGLCECEEPEECECEETGCEETWASLGYSGSDFIGSAALEAREELVAFVWAHRRDIRRLGLSEDAVGSSLWFSREGHGAGFFDYGSGAMEMQRAAGELGSVNIDRTPRGELRFY